MSKDSIKHEAICKMMKCNDMEKLMEYVYVVLENPAFVVDVGLNVLCYTDVVVDADIWNEIVLNRELKKELMDGSMHMKIEHAKALNAKHAILIEDTYGGGSQIKKALLSNDKNLGMLIVPMFHKEYEEADLEYADMVGEIIAHKMISHQGLVYHREMGKGTFFASLLEGYAYSDEQVEWQLKRTMGQVKKYWYVGVMCGLGADPEKVAQITLEEFNKMPNNCAFAHESGLVLLLNCDEEIRDFEDACKELIAVAQKNNFYIGISNCFEKITQFARHHKQAVRALEIGQKLRRHRRLYVFYELMIYDILSRIPEKEMKSYVHPDILKLKRYDDVHGTKLCQTLHVYLDSNRSQSKTAQLLYMHRNTVNYRINQCKRILDSELKNEMELFSYTLSLMVLEYHFFFG